MNMVVCVSLEHVVRIVPKYMYIHIFNISQRTAAAVAYREPQNDTRR